MLEQLFEVPIGERTDFIKEAKASIRQNLRWYPKLTKELAGMRNIDTSARNLES